MNYIEHINLKAEPFPASADPDFFYPTRQHGRILRMIEYTVTARNGLSVILGDVGTGKTTLARMLYRNFSARKQTRVHMITDPSFSTPHEMYREIAEQFNIPIPEHERGTKEALEKAFIERFGSGEVIGLLIIDEGQKMQSQILEVVRELLNFETDHFKLLQIVVFAQKEFEITLGMNSAFSGRIGLLQRIERMDFKNAQRMVRFRLERTGKDDRAASLFTTAAIWAIYNKANGNPRRIVTLCHQLLMRLVLRQKKRVTFWFVRNNTTEIMEGSDSHRSPVALILSLIILAVAVYGAMQPQVTNIVGETWLRLTAPSSEHAETAPPTLATPEEVQHASSAHESDPPPVLSDTTQQQATSEQSVVPPALQEEAQAANTTQASSNADETTVTTSPTLPDLKTVKTVSPTPPENETTQAELNTAPNATPTPEQFFDRPEDLGTIPMGKRIYVSNMIHDVYGRYDLALHRQVEKANPNIPNIDLIPAGKDITFPAVPTQEAFIPINGFFIELNETQTLEDAFNALRRFKKMGLPVRMLPYYTPTQGLIFTVLLEYYMESAKEAESLFLKLPKQAKTHAAIMTAFPADAEFYAYWDILDKKSFDSQQNQ